MASKFWVGGTGTWDNSTTTHWAISSGGAGGTAVPGASDDITFDGSSGGGTVTASSAINGLTFNSLTMGAFTGTLDFSVNNPSITLGANGSPGINCSGTGTRTLKLGSGTFTLKTSSNNCFTAATSTGLTFVGGSATLLISANGTQNAQDFNFSGLDWSGNTLSIGTRINGQYANLFGSNATFANFNIAAPAAVRLANSTTITVTNAINWTGNSTNLLYLYNDASNTRTTLALAVGSIIQWAAISNIAVTGLTLSATNSYDLGDNTGITFTTPSAGGGGSHFIGG